MINFTDWLNSRNENYGGSPSNRSGVEDLGDGGDAVANKLDKPGAFATYGDDKPPTLKNQRKYVGRRGDIVYSKKKCNCK